MQKARLTKPAWKPLTNKRTSLGLQAEFYDFLSILAYRLWHVLGTSRRGQIAVFRALRLWFGIILLSVNALN